MSKNKRDRAVVLLAPETQGRIVELSESDGGDGRTFRKKILPLGEITYPRTAKHPGGRVRFDRDYHQTLIDAHRDGAYDNPTVQLASGGVEHNADVKLTAASVLELSHQQPGDQDGPGLYATIRAHSKKDAKLFRRNPNLGVSPEIVENRTRVDGKHYPAAVHHVLATLRGRVAGLGPWRAISLSSSDEGVVIDLSTAEYKEIPVGKKRDRRTEQAAEAVMSLSEDEVEAALEAAVQELNMFTDDDDEPTRTVALSDPSVIRFESQLTDATVRLDGMSAKLAAADWSAKRGSHSRAGVPKRVLDLAEEVLNYPGESVISLSDESGEAFTVDARGVIEKMLEEFRGVISLSDSPAGSSEEPSGDQLSDEQLSGHLNAWAARSGS